MEDLRIVWGQQAPEKQARARQFRQEMTPAERLLWQSLRGKRLAGLHFRRQQVIDGFIADFYCHAAKLVIEVDCTVHERQTEYDAERSRILAARGLHLLRFSNTQVERHLEAVLAQIQAQLSPFDASPTPFSSGERRCAGGTTKQSG